MVPVRRTADFDAWLRALRDQRAKARIAIRIDRLASGNLGDVKPVGSGVSEMRIDHGPGDRLDFIRRGAALIVLLCGGDKSSQHRDIVRAKALAADLQDGDGA